MARPFEKTEVAAREVGVSKWYLYRHFNEIPAARRAGRALRWDVDALKAWMADQARNGGRLDGRDK